MSQPIIDRKKYRQEVESLKADNRMKDMVHNLAIAEGNGSSIELIDCAGFGNKLLSLTLIENANSIESMKDSKTWKKYSLDNTPAYRCVFESFVPVSDSEVLILFSLLIQVKQENRV